MTPTFLFLNYGGDFLSIAQRVKEEGYPIRFWQTERLYISDSKNVGKGILDKSDFSTDFWQDIRKIPKENLIILVDDNGKGEMIDHLRKDGFSVIGGSAFADKIEYERSFGTKLMGDLGMKLPETKTFSTIQEGIRYVKREQRKDPEKKFVFKAEGEDFAGGSKTYTSKNSIDLIEYMEWIAQDQEQQKYEIKKYELQEFIDGYEADFEASFDGEKFMEDSIALDIEEKKTGDGNKGQATGCTGNIVMYFPFNKFYDLYLKKMTPYLKRVGYVGPISINNIFAKTDGFPRALEFTPRFGWDATLTEMAIHKAAGKKISDYFLALAHKGSFDFSKKYIGCGVRVFCQTPDSNTKDILGRRFSFDESIQDNLWFYAVSKDEDFYQVEGNSVLLANTVETNFSDAIKNCYEKVLPKIYISDIYYRNEIGKRFPEVIKFLRKHEWI